RAARAAVTVPRLDRARLLARRQRAGGRRAALPPGPRKCVRRGHAGARERVSRRIAGIVPADRTGPAHHPRQWIGQRAGATGPRRNQAPRGPLPATRLKIDSANQERRLGWPPFLLRYSASSRLRLEGE